MLVRALKSKVPGRVNSEFACPCSVKSTFSGFMSLNLTFKFIPEIYWKIFDLYLRLNNYKSLKANNIPHEQANIILSTISLSLDHRLCKTFK